jgi:MFS family permease
LKGEHIDDAPEGRSSRDGRDMTGLWRRYRRLPRNVYAIGLVSLMNDASSEIIYPLLAAFLALALGASPMAIGLIEGGAESVSSLLKLFAGYLSDRLGRRKGLVVFGYALASVARTFLAVVTSWPQALAARVADRVGKGIRGAPRDALIADTVAVEARGIAFGLHRAMDHLGAVIGPLLAYVLLHLVAARPAAPTKTEFQWVFLAAAIPAFISVGVAMLFVRDVRRDDAGRSAHPPRLTLRGFDSNFVLFLSLVALFTLSNSSDAFLLLRATGAGVAIDELPLLWAALHVTKVVSSLVGGDLSDRLGRKWLITSGWLLYAAVYAGFAFVETRAEVWVLFLVYGVYFGLAEGSEKALVADLVRPEQRGTAFGLYNFAFGITVLPASLLMGLMWSVGGPQLAFLVSAAVGTLAAAMLVAVKTTRSAPQSATVGEERA